MKEHDNLLDVANRCEQALGRFAQDIDSGRQAREILTDAAARCRVLAAALLTDPTLATEPWNTGRFRLVDLVTELARQLISLLRNAEDTSPAGLRRWPRQARWEEADALYARFLELADDAVVTVPRADHATVAGARAISTARLSARDSDFAEAAEMIRTAATAALLVTHPDPRARELLTLAEKVRQVAVELTAEHRSHYTELEVAMRLAPGWKAPEADIS